MPASRCSFARVTARKAPAFSFFRALLVEERERPAFAFGEVTQRFSITGRVQDIGRQRRQPARQVIAAIDRNRQVRIDVRAIATERELRRLRRLRRLRLDHRHGRGRGQCRRRQRFEHRSAEGGIEPLCREQHFCPETGANSFQIRVASDRRSNAELEAFASATTIGDASAASRALRIDTGPRALASRYSRCQAAP